MENRGIPQGNGCNHRVFASSSLPTAPENRWLDHKVVSVTFEEVENSSRKLLSYRRKEVEHKKTTTDGRSIKKMRRRSMPMKTKIQQSSACLSHDEKSSGTRVPKTNPETAGGGLIKSQRDQAQEHNIEPQVPDTNYSYNPGTRVDKLLLTVGVIEVKEAGDACTVEDSCLTRQKPTGESRETPSSREIRRRRRSAAQRRQHQEIQTAFPKKNPSMPPTNNRGHHNADPRGPGGQYAPQDDQQNYQQQMHAHARRNEHLQSISGSSSMMGTPAANRASAGNGHHMNDGGRTTQPTPLFERLVTEEVQELKAYARIIENQNRRLAELERVHGDLENRLESESRGRVQLETTLEQREREWALKFKELEADRDHWKDVVRVEQTKNARLIDQVVRKDQDIHRMLQRKYDNHRESPAGHSHSIRNVRSMMSERPGSAPQNSSQDLGQRADQHFRSPHEILSASGSMEAVRIRNVNNLLSDFFGL